MSSNQWQVAIKEAIFQIPKDVKRSEVASIFSKFFIQSRVHNCILCENKITGYKRPVGLNENRFIEDIKSRHKIRYKDKTVNGLVCAECIEKYEIKKRMAKTFRYVPPFRGQKNETCDISRIFSCIKNSGAEQTGYVYLIKCEKIYKIGRARNIKGRFRRYQTENPYPSDLVFAYEVNSYIEKETYLLREFTDKNIRGEWFGLNDQDVTKIENYLKLE